jgi:hypothetical protein
LKRGPVHAFRDGDRSAPGSVNDAGIRSLTIRDDPEAIETVIRIATEQGAAVETLAYHPIGSTPPGEAIPNYETLIIMARGRLSQITAQHLIQKDGPSTDE